MTPQIDGLSKMSPVLSGFNTHLWVSKKIDGKTFIFRVNLGMWPLKLMVSAKWALLSDNWALFWGFQHTFMGFQGDRLENIHFESKPMACEPLKLLIFQKMCPVVNISTHIYGISKKIDGKTFIFRVNLGMWPLKLIVSGKWALFWGFHHTFMGSPRR